MRRFFRWVRGLFKRRRPYAPIEPVKIDGQIVKIDIHGAVNFTSEERTFLLDAMAIKTNVLNSVEFATAFQQLKCTETKGKSMTEVYQELVSGADKYAEADSDLDYFITLYGHASVRRSTVGYTYPNTIKLWTNRYYYNKWMQKIDDNGNEIGMADLAGHLFHEYLHNLGYDHLGNKSTSMVYRAGYLMRDMCRDYIQGAIYTPIKVD